ncbi:MAG TPA: alpha/beta hydrolase [Caulobacteraceae bacterium]|nr:alpha/beta hydrolase [Caulobacteraceae bacterium]
MRIAALVFGAAALLAGGACAGPIRDNIYPAPRAPLVAADLPDGAVLASVTTADGLKLIGARTPARAGMPTLVVFHGNASSAADTLKWLSPAIAQGYGVVAAEYRGYSGNPGDPNEAGLAADADAFMQLAQQAAGSGPVWIVGHSLGGGVALGLANRARSEVVVTVGTFTRLKVLAPAIARPLLGAHVYDNERAVAQGRTPFYLVHGLHDDVVPSSHGETLHRRAGAAKRPGASFVVPEADHKPSGEIMLAVLEAIRTGPDRERPAAPSSAAGTVLLIPFGESRSANP